MNKEFNLITVYILLSLVDNNLNRYELIKEIKTHDVILFTGTFSPKLKKLETDNLIIALETKIAGENNIKYKITRAGMEYLNSNMNSLEKLVSKMRSIL
jgi:DNA-binding PadR family transcriptional regulator